MSEYKVVGSGKNSDKLHLPQSKSIETGAINKRAGTVTRRSTEGSGPEFQHIVGDS